jgi:hypothetical protein
MKVADEHSVDGKVLAWFAAHYGVISRQEALAAG